MTIETKAAILRGIKDSRVGRVKPWSVVKKELGISSEEYVN